MVFQLTTPFTFRVNPEDGGRMFYLKTSVHLPSSSRLQFETVKPLLISSSPSSQHLEMYILKNTPTTILYSFFTSPIIATYPIHSSNSLIYNALSCLLVSIFSGPNIFPSTVLITEIFMPFPQNKRQVHSHMEKNW
jgi:hypothetical protein